MNELGRMIGQSASERGFRANERSIFARERAWIEGKGNKKQSKEKKVDKTLD